MNAGVENPEEKTSAILLFPLSNCQNNGEWNRFGYVLLLEDFVGHGIASAENSSDKTLYIWL